MQSRIVSRIVAGVLLGLILPIAPEWLAAASHPDPKRTKWWWCHHQTAEDLQQLIRRHNARIVDIEVESTSPYLFSAALVENTRTYKRIWWWYYGKSAKQIQELVNRKGARILDLERYAVDGAIRFAAVLVSGKGAGSTAWWWFHGKTASEINNLVEEKDARIFDLDVEQTDPHRFTVLLTRDKKRKAWWWYYGKSAEELTAVLQEKQARIVDLETYPLGRENKFAAVLAADGDASPHWWWYHGLPEKSLDLLARRHGARIADIETDSGEDGRRFSALLVDNGVPRTGRSVPSLKPIERRVTHLMKRWQIPGAAAAVARDGRLIYARGYGLSNIEQNQVVQPHYLFRIAGLSKLVTRSAILKLCQEEGLRLEDRALGYLDSLKLGPLADDRVQNLTIQHLLDDQAGWDEQQLGFNPMFHSNQIASRLGISGPAGSRDVIRYMLANHRLNFAPGTARSDSHFGYNILGRIVEAVSGESYEHFVRLNILYPLGIGRMKIGHSLPGNRAAEEVKYYPHLSAPLERSVFPEGPERVAGPDGGFHLEAMDSSGGWLASVVDLIRFTHQARPAPNSGDWSFNGSLPGSRSRLVRQGGGSLIMVLLFNSGPRDDQTFERETAEALEEGRKGVRNWPKHNLFRDF